MNTVSALQGEQEILYQPWERPVGRSAFVETLYRNNLIRIALREHHAGSAATSRRKLIHADGADGAREEFAGPLGPRRVRGALLLSIYSLFDLWLKGAAPRGSKQCARWCQRYPPPNGNRSNIDGSSVWCKIAAWHALTRIALWL